MKKAIWIPLLCLGCLLLIGAAVWAWIWFGNEYTLELNMAGDRTVTVEYGEEYTDAGAKASFYGSYLQKEPIDVAVTVSGSVNTRRVGTYQLRYEANWEGLRKTAYRTVSVVDTQLPEITLLTKPGTYTLPGRAYREEGFTARDNVDGDLTSAVSFSHKDGVVTYTVTDSSGNTATATREIYYHDPTPPVLSLKGGTYMVVHLGNAYTDPGCTATDNIDGDITDKIIVEGGVDVNKAATYAVTYTVADSYGNTASAKRFVTVIAAPSAQPQQPAPDGQPAPNPQPLPNIVQPSGKVIYLTFDDGPGPYTARLLDVLAKYGVKATFFVVNTAYIDLTARMVQEGHAVGIHTTTHRFNEIYASDEAFFNDLYTMQGIIEAHTGVKTMLMRFPGGSSNTVSRSYSPGIMTRLTQAVTAQGFRYFDWNVDSRDAGGAWDSSGVYGNVVGSIGSKQASFVLQHDIKSYSVDAVESIIVWGLANGYTFLPLDMTSPACEHRVNN